MRQATVASAMKATPWYLAGSHLLLALDHTDSPRAHFVRSPMGEGAPAWPPSGTWLLKKLG